MRTRHMLGCCRVPVVHARSRMARNPKALVEDLDRSVGEPRIDGLAQQPKRHRVVMITDLDVIVGRNPAALPFSILVGLDREPLQRRSIDAIEQLTPALAECPHYLRADRRHTLSDRRVEFVEREEAPLSQLRQHEPFDNLDGHFHLGLVARFAHPGGQHDKAVVVGQILIGPVDTRLVA
jgi:hypothetical protein